MGVNSLSDFNTVKTEPFADAGADVRCVFANTSGKDKCVQSAKCRCEGANPLFRLIAKEHYGFSGPHILIPLKSHLAG